MNIAIITGATSGLGKAFAEKVYQTYKDLDEIWLLARRKERLEAFASEHSQTGFPRIRAISIDLSERNSYNEICDQLLQERPSVKMLLNVAGFDVPDDFEKATEKDIYATIDLNVTGTTMLTKATLPYMQQGSFCIIVGSIGSFAPLPGQAVYAASKVFCKHLSIALREELKPKGINVMLLSPGNMKTEMYQKTVEHLSGGTGEYKKFDIFPFLDLDKVTTRALRKAQRGCAQWTPRFPFAFYHFLCKIIPSTWMVKFNKVQHGE